MPGPANTDCIQSSGSHCGDLSKDETQSDLPSMDLISGAAAADGGQRQGPWREATQDRTVRPGEGRRGGSGSSRGAFQREDQQDHGGEKGRLKEDARAFWSEHWSKSQGRSLGKTDGNSFGERIGIQSPGTDFSMEYKQKDSLDKRFNRPIKHVFGSYHTY